MQKFKITATKNQKKYSLVLSAESQKEAQEKVHNEGYSILKIEEYSGEEGVKNTSVKRFIFNGGKLWEEKKWIIMGDDIFKLYVKLRDELDYTIFELYPEDDNLYENEDERKKLVSNLEAWYLLQKQSTPPSKEKKQEKTKEQNMNSVWVSWDFYLKKQLESTHILIDAVVSKFHTLFRERESFHIEDETYNKLQDIYTKLITIKATTNLPKLREVWELALIKLAEVELKGLQYEKKQQAQEYLKETNKLLKKIGSREQFRDPESDMILYLTQTFYETVDKLKLSSIKEIFKKEEKKVVDTDTYDYLKLILQLEKYEKKLKDLNIYIFKNFLVFYNPFFTSDDKIKTLLKKKVIEQNISILKAKKSWRMSSYTSIKKGFQKTLDFIADFLKFIETMSLAFITLFSFILLLSIPLWDYIQVNIATLPYFLLFFLLLILTEIRRHLIVLSFYIVFFVFSFIFIQVNF